MADPSNAKRGATPAQVARAAALAAETRARHREIVESLPSVRNPEVDVHVPRDAAKGRRSSSELAIRKTPAGRQRQAEAIREKVDAERLQALGKARKFQVEYELFGGQSASRLQDAMTNSQMARFQAASRAIASVSAQALAILFKYEGGQEDYSSALERILSSPESRDVEEGLDKLEALADLAQKAGRVYAPARIGRLNV